MTFDPTKPVQTRDGRPVKILATGVLEKIPGTGACRLPGQTFLASVDGEARYFSPCGAYSPGTSSDWDLINIPEKAKPSGQDGGEREKIVAYLRKVSCYNAAEAIEAGDHLKGNSDG